MERILGLTLTKKSIKICEVGIKKGKISILNLKERIISGVFGKELENSIKRFLKQSRVKTKNVSFGIFEEDIMVRVNDYPKMPEEDLKKIVLDEISNYKIFEGDFPVINLIKLKEIENRIRYLLVIIPRKKVEEKLNFLKKIGLNPVNIDIPSFASFRANKIFRKEYFKGNGVFTFIGENKTTLIFFTNGEPLILREFEIGLNSLSENFDLFRTEISNTISYFSREEKKNIEKIIVTGIENGVEEVSQKLKETFGIEILLGAPLSDMPLYFSSSIGLSLFNYEDKLKIDIIPKDIKERAKDEFKLFMLILSTTILGFFIISLSIYLIDSIKVTSESIKNIKDNLKSVESSIISLKDIEKKYSEALNKQKEIDEIVNKFILNEKSSYINAIYSLRGDIKIVNLNESSNNFTLNILSNGFNPIFDFVDNLKNSKLFREIKIDGMSRNSDGTCNAIIQIVGGKWWQKSMFQK